jgi:branched-chain amino acid transport system ATP-binding protein
MLEVDGLSVHYGAVTAVSEVSLSVDAGECVALLGPNGAGKSSTLRAISGLGDYDGEVRCAGCSLRGLLQDRIAKAGVIHVPEGRRLFGHLTVHENLQVGRSALGKRRAGYSIEDVYDLFPPLVELRRTPGWSLSGGEQQMVAIGRGLVAGPRLLMLDEPSLGLAPLVTEAVFAALRQITATTAVLLVEQNTHLALGVAHRGYVLAGGRIVLQGTSAELSDRQTLIDSFLGVETEAQHAVDEQPGS